MASGSLALTRCSPVRPWMDPEDLHGPFPGVARIIQIAQNEGRSVVGPKVRSDRGVPVEDAAGGSAADSGPSGDVTHRGRAVPGSTLWHLPAPFRESVKPVAKVSGRYPGFSEPVKGNVCRWSRGIGGGCDEPARALVMAAARVDRPSRAAATHFTRGRTVSREGPERRGRAGYCPAKRPFTVSSVAWRTRSMSASVWAAEKPWCMALPPPSQKYTPRSAMPLKNRRARAVSCFSVSR